MKRIAIKSLVFLLLGAVVNVAVAWGCATWVDFDWRQKRTQGYDHFAGWGFETTVDPTSRFIGYTASRYQRFGSQRVTVFHSSAYTGMPGRTTIPFEDMIPQWAIEFLDIPELSGERIRTTSAHTHSAIVDGRGWPCLALWGGMKRPILGLRVLRYGQPVQLVERNHGIIRLDSKTTGPVANTDHRFLPTRPILPGFLINTIFYTGVLWLLCSAPFAARRLIRKQRGKCVRCGYDLRHAEHDVCPECGAER